MSAKTEKSQYPQACNPLILHAHRLMEAFAKSNDERDFYLDKVEGFILYVDLDEVDELLKGLEVELLQNAPRYLSIPKMTFYESKKLMEGFVNEKVYDIDVKEKLLDIISSKEARENFLEYIYDHHAELEKWQQYYQERSRIRIIEWLRAQNIRFVFEEDLDFTKNVLEKIKENLFTPKAPADVISARKLLDAKSKTYYSDSALNPRPKRGRPPKQQQKVEVEPTITSDFYSQVPAECRKFLFTPDLNAVSKVTFSSKYENEEELLASIREGHKGIVDPRLESLNQKLESLRQLSGTSLASKASLVRTKPDDSFDDEEAYDEEADLAWDDEVISFNGGDDEEEDEGPRRRGRFDDEESDEDDEYGERTSKPKKKGSQKKAPEKRAAPQKAVKEVIPAKGAVDKKASAPKPVAIAKSAPAGKSPIAAKAAPKVVPTKKPVEKTAALKSSAPKPAVAKKPEAKGPAKTVAKPATKAPVKAPTKPAAKTTAKPVAKAPVKSVAKAPVKTAAKAPVKTAAKAPVKPAAKAPVKTAAKAPVKPAAKDKAVAKKK
jgi:hypothetical protein